MAMDSPNPLPAGGQTSALDSWASAIISQFEVTPSQLQEATELFVRQLREGLAQDGTSLLQVPSYVAKLPDGTEKGTCLAIDLGGTNLRVCSVDLRGDSTYSVIQTKVAIPMAMMTAPSYKDLFSFIAGHVESFLLRHLPGSVEEWRNLLQEQGMTAELRHKHSHSLGFTFSFTFDQQAIDRGSLMYWTKAFTIKDAVGRDPCAMLQEALDDRRLPLIVTALANDTVGTLAARAYSAGATNPGRRVGSTLLGAIFGTGTNGAYMERLEDIKKLHSRAEFADPARRRGEFMALNTEWGNFDNKLEVLPVTPYDAALDRDSTNPDDQPYEKRISGMYLGELLRLILVDQWGGEGRRGPGWRIKPGSRLYVPNSIDSSFLSALVSDRTPGLVKAHEEIERVLEASGVTMADAQAVRAVAEAIGIRAARLSAIAIAGVVIQSGRCRNKNEGARNQMKDDSEVTRTVSRIMIAFGKFRAVMAGLASRLACWLGLGTHASQSTAGGETQAAIPHQIISAQENGGDGKGEDNDICQEEQESGENDVDEEIDEEIDIGVDGSLFEHFPGFESNMRAALREIPAIGPEVERRIRMGTAKDGSGVGAALIAWTVAQSRLQA